MTNMRNERGDITTDSMDPAVFGQGGGAPGSNPDEPEGGVPAPSNSAVDERDVTAELCRAFHKLHVPSFPEFVSDVWSLLPIAQ